MANQLTLKNTLHHGNGLVYSDYYVNDSRLASRLHVEGLITPFGWLGPESEKKFARMLLGLAESDFRKNRVPLFLCSECADYGCGVVTCEVEFTREKVTWRNFAQEVDYNDDCFVQEKNTRDFRLTFEAEAYQSLFQAYDGDL
ncbi:MAG: hypothetical protein ACQKBY_13105 [Verrucomicrobiales bacterium]